MATKEVKKITVGLIFSWIFGVMFFFAGLGVITSGQIGSGIVIMILSICIIPLFNKFTAEKFNFEISGGIKWLIAIAIFILFAIAIGNSEKAQSQELNTQTVQSLNTTNTVVQTNTPTVNPKEEYINNYLKLEDLKVGEGYGTGDFPGYSPKRPTVEGKLRNTGTETIKTVKIIIYFLDSQNIRIKEKEYYVISADSMVDTDGALKPNYVKDFGFVVDNDAPSDWSGKVEAKISYIEFSYVSN